MRWLYVVAGVALYIKMLALPNPMAETLDTSITQMISQETGVPNAVSGIIFRNRLFDTLFEVLVFSMTISGARFLMANEIPLKTFRRFTDQPSIVLARLGATIAALISVELALRGHLSPGGGFAAGVAGGTAIGLIAITTSSARLESVAERWHCATLETVCVIAFLLASAASLMGAELPQGTFGTFFSGGTIPLLNLLVALKVALGSMTVVLVFIRYRGLL